jgi:hypothetical protein
MQSWVRWCFATLACLGLILWCTPARAEPSKVVVGTYINKIEDLNFKENKFSLDFFVWFRWEPKGALLNFKPLESFDLMNGKIEGKSSVVEKKIGDINYASARVTASMSRSWELERFPFDAHKMQIYVEDSELNTVDLVFEADTVNSKLGNEIDMAGWLPHGFSTSVMSKLYESNYGDTSIPTGNKSEYSRFVVDIAIKRTNYGAAIKLLSTVLLAVAVAFAAFTVKASNLDARFGMAVGALFAVAANGFVAASAVPDGGSMTVADEMHMVALGFIFASVCVSSYCLKMEQAGREAVAQRIDDICKYAFPIAFYSWAFVTVWRAIVQ